MKFTALGAAASAALALTCTQGVAATIVFDDFTVAQTAVDVPFPPESNTSSVALGTITRTLTAQNFTNNGAAVGATVLEVAGGALSFSNKDQSTGLGRLTYTNVGDIDFGPGGFFFFNVGVFDNIAQFSAEAIDGAGNVGTYSEVLGPGFDPTLRFSQFDGSVDFNDIASLSFTISTEGGPARVDGSLNSIEISAIPLPAGGFLLLGGLGLLSALRRKKAL